MKIVTNFVYPPIPIRQFDWSAIDDDTYDGEGCKIGYGATEQDAIDNLLDQMNDGCLSDAEQKAQAARCGCRGSDDYCVCQNAPDHQTKTERRALAVSSQGRQMTELSDDTLITLKDACEIFFRGKVTVATLKAEHAKGNLDMSKIGRSYWTTLAKLKEMDSRCRVEAPAPSSGSTTIVRSGPSSTDESASAQASALRKLQERKKLLGITSRRSTQ